jgi:hypothetical protein
VNTVFWTTISLGCPHKAAAHVGILSLIVFPDDEEIDVFRSPVREGSSHTGQQFDGAKIDVLLERPANRDQETPQGDVVGNSRVPNGSEEDRVVRPKKVPPVFGHHPSVLRVIFAVPIELLVPEAEPPVHVSHGVENIFPGGDGFLADPVSGDDRQPDLFHGMRPPSGLTRPSDRSTRILV